VDGDTGREAVRVRSLSLAWSVSLWLLLVSTLGRGGSTGTGPGASGGNVAVVMGEAGEATADAEAASRVALPRASRGTPEWSEPVLPVPPSRTFGAGALPDGEEGSGRHESSASGGDQALSSVDP